MSDSPMKITVHYADCTGNPKNCCYPNTGVAGSEEEFRTLIARDHTFAVFRDHRRSLENFEGTRYLILDNDNDHSEDSEQWFSPQDLAFTLPEVPFVVYTSRNHMKAKNGKSARPRWHAVFPLSERITDPEAYRKILRTLAALIPGADPNATDAARFFFGTSAEVVLFHPGEVPADRFLRHYSQLETLETEDARCMHRNNTSEAEAERAFAALGEEIPEGSRNTTLHTKAVRLLKRFGDTAEARTAYENAAARCAPPLPEREIQVIWQSARRFYQTRIAKAPGYIPPAQYNRPQAGEWEEPIEFMEFDPPEFPLEAFPPVLRDYTAALAEGISVPVDMAATCILGVLATASQGKYRVRTNQNHTEPVNLFILDAMRPSERKSSVLSHVVAPIYEYEDAYNTEHAEEIAISRQKKQMLTEKVENIRRALSKIRQRKKRRSKQAEQEVQTEQAAQEEQEAEEEKKELETALDRATAELTNFREKKPMKLTLDNVTMEKLISVMSENHSCGSIISSEPGIFEMIKGMYTNKQSNFDIILKGYSGDHVSVDRMGREGERINHPALTMLLMTQTDILNSIMSDPKFRNTGLTTRFLCCMPRSRVGDRPFNGPQIPEAVQNAYGARIRNMLEDPYPPDRNPEPELITLSPEASATLEDFHYEMEAFLKEEENNALLEWGGKLVGNTARIAALLCRASVDRGHDSGDYELFLPELVIDGKTMAGAVEIARYYLAHARAVFGVTGVDPMIKDCMKTLERIREKQFRTFKLRDIQLASSQCPKKETLMPILEQLEDHEYIRRLDPVPYSGKGRPSTFSWEVNPYVFDEYYAA